VKKKILLIPLALLLAISLVAIGCPAPAPPPPPPPAPPTVRVPTLAEPMTLEEIEAALEPLRGRELVVVSWGGAWQRTQTKAQLDPFAEKFGIKVIQESPTDLAKIMAMVDAGNTTWDVVDVETRQPEMLGPRGYLEELDYTIIDPRTTVPEAVTPWAIGTIFWSTVLVYHEEAFPEGGPQSFVDFWDVEKFPGPRSLRQNPYGNIMFALVADGVPVDQIYPLLWTKKEETLDRAFRKLDEIKPHITVWWTSGSQPVELLARKEVVMATAYNGRIYELQQEGIPLKIVWNGAHASIDSWVIPKGAPNKDVAMLFIAWATQPEIQASITEFIPYGPPNTLANAYIDPTWGPVVSGLPSAPENLAVQVIADGVWWGENIEQLLERWTEWVLE